MRRSFDHALRVTGISVAARTAYFTAPSCYAVVSSGDQEIVPALVAAGAGKAVGEDAAFEIASEGPLDIRWWRLTGRLGGEFQPGFEASLDNAISQRLL